MGTTLKFSGPDAGRANELCRKLSTTGNGGNTDLHELGDAVIDAVAEEIQREDAERSRQAAEAGVPTAERFTIIEVNRRLIAWRNLDVNEIPEEVWRVLTAEARSAFQAISGSDRHDRAFDIGVIDDPYGSGERVLSVTCLHTDDSEDGTYGLSAPVHADTIDVYEQDQEALARVQDLRTTDAGRLQAWWVEALQGALSTIDDDDEAETAAEIVMNSMTTNLNFPFPDATGNIRCPHGVTFEIIDTTAHDAAVQTVRDGWHDDDAINDADLVDSLEDLAVGILGEAMAEFGDRALIGGISVEDAAIAVSFLSDDERELGLPGVEIVTAPANQRLMGRLERAVTRSVTSANAAWVRALGSAVDRVAEYSPHSREAIVHVVERSTVMLAEEELAVGA